MLTASGLEPRWLTLEITESSVMENHERSLEVLRQLRMLGVRLSIDDFGTGYSSLHQLRGLPVHEVKIDRSFVEVVDGDEADRAVVRAVVELCDSLGLTSRRGRRREGLPGLRAGDRWVWTRCRASSTAGRWRPALPWSGCCLGASSSIPINN